MSLLSQFKLYIQKLHLFEKKDTLLIAVSGGADSTVLCELCQQAGYNFAIAHCNFQLRGEESTRDENFVRVLATKYEVPIFVAHYDTSVYALNEKKSIQEAARILRYDFFKALLIEHKFASVLTAHHADDNVETVLMNFFKGTGINGMRGILPKHDNIVRPLLFATRQQIEMFAKENNIDFVNDSSNEKNDYTRNYFRNELLPAVEKVFPEVAKNLINNIDRFADVAAMYNQSIDKIKQDLLEIKGKEIHIPVLKLAKTKPLQTIIYEIIKDYNFTAAQVGEVEKLLVADSGKYITSLTHRILKNRNWLIISNAHHFWEASLFLIEANTSLLNYPAGQINIQTLPEQENLDSNKNIAYIDASHITFPLLVRKWKQGDYFYPLGMDKKKKLSRFFIDQKLSLLEKENVWVIESDKKIVWVVGLRIDNRFKMTDRTKKVIKFSIAQNVVAQFPS
jgi:tRNA(Ile)-lysidine synthase